MRRIPVLLLAGSLLLHIVPLVSAAAPQAQEDVWAPFRFFVGSWEGAGQGSPGSGTGEQTFEFILRGRYLHIRNKAVYAPQEKNPSGEVHEDWGVFSYDRARKTFVLRQFHVEGFVNQYVLESPRADGRTFVFVTEAIENIPPGFRARLTYRIVDADTFQQTFDLAAPGKEFECYSTGVMKRKK
jgi:hypothetical protein